MITFFKDQTIKKRIMAVVESKIMSAQKEFDAGCEKIEEEYTNEIDFAEKKRFSRKVDLADELVSNITNKII